MKATLQYSANGSTGWQNCGSQISAKDLAYTVNPVNDTDRTGNAVTIAFDVEVSATPITLTSGFLSASEWFFRLYFASESKKIELGEREYTIDFDGLPGRNAVNYHKINIKFEITTAQYSSYTTPVEDVPS